MKAAFGKDELGKVGDLIVPDVAGEVIGYRAWNVVGTAQTPRLMSVTHRPNAYRVDGIWPTNRWYEAICEGRGSDHAANGDTIPVERCTCGLYAAKSIEQLMKLGYAAYGDMTDKVIGEVGFVGKVIEGSQGWRAQRGRIVRLYVPFEKWELLADRLASAYNVPVEPASWVGSEFVTLDELARRYAPGEGS